MGLTPGAEATSQLRRALGRGRARGRLALFGPAFVAAVAYVDPGNVASNFKAGSEHGYLLVWVVVGADLMAMMVQYLTAKLGIATGTSLPQVCASRYDRRLNALLWVESEMIAMATDMAEITGAAVGINLVFGVPLFPAGLLTGGVSFVILGLEVRGYRRFELAIIGLLGLVGLGFLWDLVDIGHQSWTGAAGGLVPRLAGGDTASLMVAIIGATVMPHVVYLHSALHAGRIRPADDGEAQTIRRYSLWDCVAGLGMAGAVNLSMLFVAAALFSRTGLTGVSDLGSIHSHLAKMVGGGSALAFGAALIASGLSSSAVGTYAGQVVMAGFMNWRIPLTARRLVTMAPSLTILALAVNPTDVLVYSQIALSFGIPFALVPLVVHTSDRRVMGALANRPTTTVLAAACTALIIASNVYLLVAISIGGTS